MLYKMLLIRMLYDVILKNHSEALAT